MAKEFLSSHGIDIDSIMSKVQFGDQSDSLGDQTHHQSISRIIGVRLPEEPPSTSWDISISSGKVSEISPHDESSASRILHLPGIVNGQNMMLLPSLCQAHIHLDKCFLLDDEKYQDLEILEGDFQEAMDLTGEAKSRFENDDLLRRGRRLIEESCGYGVTAMRAFVEVDEIVGLKCVEAGLELKERFGESCNVQICAFAQLPLFSGADDGETNRRLMEAALENPKVDVIGATPYVEQDQDRMKKNIQWTIDKALCKGKHLDFHLDYNLNQAMQPLIWYVIDELKRQNWEQRAKNDMMICLGHCTRMTMFTDLEWTSLRDEIGSLPINFVGLPASDIFMMGRPTADTEARGQRMRGTLQILDMIKTYQLQVAMATNNVGNAFTPQGTCDPLLLTSLATAAYHAGTKEDGQMLFECVSSRAKRAIGLPETQLQITVGSIADFVLIRGNSVPRIAQSIPTQRKTIANGKLLNGRETLSMP